MEAGRERCPRGYDNGAVESREDKRSVRENEPWVSSRAAGALAVFYTSAYLQTREGTYDSKASFSILLNSYW